MTTTLDKIRACNPCADGWRKLLAYLGKTRTDDEPLDLLTILDSNGLDDALWALRAVEGYDREIRLYAAWCVRRVQHLDAGIPAFLDTVERYANGEASKDDLAAARESAREAVWAAEREAAREAAWAAARDAAWDAARDAAWEAAREAARDASRDASRNAEREAQEAEFRRMLTEGYPR